MDKLNMAPMSEEFHDCWIAAMDHLDAQVQDGIQFWLRSHPNPPYLEHLSFRLGNQLFFIRVVDVEDRVSSPGTFQGLLTIADGCQGQACLMPMLRFLSGWEPVLGNWGLSDARTGISIHPLALVSDEQIVMTDWEIHDVAVQMVRDTLIHQGYNVYSWQTNPAIQPAIWCIGDSGGSEWIVVRGLRYPMMTADRPGNWEEIASTCANESVIGHFAWVSVQNADQQDVVQGHPVLPLLRGYQLSGFIDGLPWVEKKTHMDRQSAI